MKYNIRNNWVTTAGMIGKHPVLLMPFVFIAFFEFLALEIVCFASRAPLLSTLGPIIRKFFGEEYLHYPGSVFIAPQAFYYLDVAIYVILGVALTAVSVNMFNNYREGRPVRAGAIGKNTIKKYISFVLFGALMIFLMTLLKKGDAIILRKALRLASNHIEHKMLTNIYMLVMPLSLYVINLFLQLFFILTVPVIVIEKKGIVRALWRSVTLGLTNFFNILGIIFLPFLIYLPIILLKSRAAEIGSKTFPELAVILTGASLIIAVFIDSFMILCASQFLIDNERLKK